jgi:hypothetical protein
MTYDEGPSESTLQRMAAIVWALFVHALFAVIALGGGLTVYVMAREWLGGGIETGPAIVFSVFGIVMLAIGFGFFYLAYVGAPNFLGRLEREREKYADQPWLVKKTWRRRRVVHSTKYTAWFMWFWCLAWWGILGFLWSVNHELIIKDLTGPWSTAIPTSIPFVAGLIGLLFAVSLTWQRFRYGDAVLTIDTLPGYLGEKFRGKVSVRLGKRPEKAVTAKLTCGSVRGEHRTDARGESETVYVTDELWSAQVDVQPTQMMLSNGSISVPIEIELPEDLPESGHVLDEPQIVWKLALRPQSALDQPLSCEFEVPIFARRGAGAE